MGLPIPLYALENPAYNYQEWAIDHGRELRRSAIVASPGAGKTRIVCEILREEGAEVILVVVPQSGMPGWKRQIRQWYGDVPVTVVGEKKLKDVHKRKIFWDKVAKGEYKGIVLINYAIFRIDRLHIYGRVSKKARHWDAVVMDEYHKALRNRGSATFKAAQKLCRFIPIVLPTSGTAIGRHPGTVWTALHLSNPQQFSSYWKFVREYCLTDDTFGGMQILGVKPSMEGFYKRILHKHLTIIPDEMVADQLPEGKRIVLDVTPTDKQMKHYDELVEDMITQFDDSNILIEPNALTLRITLQKLMCCPALVNKSLGMGAGFDAIVAHLEIESHVIIFVPFIDALKLVADELAKQGHHVTIIQGGLQSDELGARLTSFKQNRGILVCTAQFAESFDCETCDTSFFLGYPTVIDQLIQAEGRTRRAISEHRFVKWYYICNNGTIDDVALMGIQDSFSNITKTMSVPKEYIKALREYKRGEQGDDN